MMSSCFLYTCIYISSAFFIVSSFLFVYLSTLAKVNDAITLSKVKTVFDTRKTNYLEEKLCWKVFYSTFFQAHTVCVILWVLSKWFSETVPWYL